MAIEMTFKKMSKNAENSPFEFNDLYGIKCYTALAHKDLVFQYFFERRATPLGEGKWINDNSSVFQFEEVRAFVYEGSLYVCRTIGDITTVFNYSAGASILLSEAFTIVNRHYEISRL